MANITVTLFWDMDLRKWTTTLAGTTETAPQTGIVQGEIVKFAVRFVQGGVAVALTAPVFTASGIKADNDFTGSYLIQLSAPVLSDTTLYTFTVSPLNSANLNTFLQTYRNTWCALEIYDSANGILTTPLELQITPGYSLSGTPTDNAPGVVSVAAGKTVTFPLSLTFPAAAGTNGYHLALLNSTTGTTEWVVDATGTTIATDPIWTAAGQLVYGTGTGTAAALAAGATTSILVGGGAGAPVWTIATGTGAPVRENTPTLIAPILGAATASSINAATGTLTIGVQTINLAAGAGTNSAGGSINLSGGTGGSENTYGGSINLSGSSGATADDSSGGSINLSAGAGTSCSGGSINMSGSVSAAGGSINMSGGSVIGGSIDTTAGGSITTGTGNLTGPSASGTIVLLDNTAALTNKTYNGHTFTAGSSTFTGTAGQTYTFPTTTATLARTDATAQTFSAAQTITSTTRNGLIVSATVDDDAASPTDCVAVFQQGPGTGGGVFTDAAINLRATSSGAYVNTFIGSNAAGRINITGNGSSTTLNVANSNSPNGNGGSGVVLTGGGNITNNGANIMTPEAIAPALNAAGTCSATITTTGFALNGVNALSLANGTNGQIKIISCTAVTAAGTATLTPTTSAADYSTIAFTAAGQTATLQFFTTGGWYILSVRGAVPA